MKILRTISKTLYRFLFFGLMLISISLLSFCDNSVDTIDVTASKLKKEVKLKDVLEALGGTTEFTELKTMKYTIAGSAFEFEEEEPSQENPIEVREYGYLLSSQLQARKLKIEYTNLKSNYPLVYSGEGTKVIIDDDQGSLSGQYDVTSYYFGRVAPKPLFSNRIEALLKNYSMGNPLELLKEVQVSANNLNFKTSDLIYKIPTIVSGLYINLYIDNVTFLPIKASVLESDFLHGDSLFEVHYANWDEFSGIKFPTAISYTFRGDTIREETISNVLFNPSFTSDEFQTEAVPNPLPYDVQLAEKGIYFSQWYSRFFDLGIAVDFPLNQAVVARDTWVSLGIPDQTVGENLKIIGRPDTAYWGVAVKTSNGVILIDPNYSPEWSGAMLDAVRGNDGFPNEEIAGVVVTHTHVDHLGGIREIANQTDTVYINATARAYMEAVLDAAHTLVPDKLMQQPKAIHLVDVDNLLTLDDGAVELHAVNMNNGGSNPHSEDMLLVYVPEYQAIVQADLFNAGGLFAIFAGATLFPMDDTTKTLFKQRAQFLLDYISENNMNVSVIIGAHGGVASLQQLQFVAQ